MRNIPTIIELKEAITNDFKSKLNLSDVELKTVLDATTMVLSAQFKLVNLYLSDIQNQIFPDTADTSENGGTLERFGQIYLNRNPNPATIGVFEATVTGTSGSVLRSGLTFKSNENSKNSGQIYVLDSEYILTGTSDVIEIRSIRGGLDYSLNIADELTITEPIIGVENIIVISAITTEPKAAENIEEYRQQILDSIQLEPQGGSKTDYRLWSADAQGVRKVYPYVRDSSAGNVDVYVEATIEDSTDGNGTPTTTLLDDVLEVIEFDPDDTKPLNERGRRPIQAIVETISVNVVPVDVQITGLDTNTTAVQTAITNNIKNHLYDIRPYVSGADLARNRNDILYSQRLSSVATDVLESANFFTGFQMQVDGVNENNYQFTLGNIPYLRNITFNV
jgi:uncharacterized phage protein gp47/JayE